MTGWFNRLLADCRGATALIVGLALPALLGAAGLAIDANLLFLQSHRLQIAADAGAYAAALMLGNATAQASSPASYKTIATNTVAGITGGGLYGTGLTVQVAVAADFSNVTVTLTSSQSSLFAAVLGQGAFSLSASAKAGAPASTPCVLSLATSASAAINVYGSAQITGTGCTVFANSSSSTALTVSNGGSVTATSIATHGNYTTTPSNPGTFSPTPLTGQTAVVETSYSGIVVPSYGSCTQTDLTVNAGGTLSPGTYCGTTTLGANGKSAVTMASGIYYFYGSSSSAGNLVFEDVPVNANGVTMVFVGPAPGAVLWQDSAAGTFSASTSGVFAGVLIYQACASNNALVTTQFEGGASITITGGIYLPCGTLSMENGTTISTTSGSTAKVEANTFVLLGNANLNITGTGGAPTASNVNLLQ